MNKKLIAIDLDGTALNNQSDISKRTVNTINKLIHQGNIVSIVTGRPPRLVENIYNKIGLNNPMITFNGSLGYNPKDQWDQAYEYNIDKNIVFKLLEKSKEIGINLMTVEGKNLFLANKSADTSVGFFPTDLNKDEIISKDNLKENPICLTLHVDKPKKATFIDYVKNNYGDILTVSPWGGPDPIIEVAAKNVSKVTGLNKLADYYNIPNKDIIAFGDEFNDESMIKYAGLGVAMKNGQPKIKEIADDITEYDNNSDGMARYLEKYFKI
ncbi:Cof-type HAD-IIB family hydrolase [Apilactobacillus apisilvae]|uniref:Cof-type HAD-IIB family hydrolase n=1 Tax=Apilactobacillus apisilvae TaxID=2923364 RepID=A0ABY4PHP7_9LACO|nr:Cof-type HAD-IIB family hydrolase [Apilactobacillus apisilvae]UQS85353.1 Cof-type HAD-IIB family hydrolase [Apilactobacillus apisilvae]